MQLAVTHLLGRLAEEPEGLVDNHGVKHRQHVRLGRAMLLSVLLQGQRTQIGVPHSPPRNLLAYHPSPKRHH